MQHLYAQNNRYTISGYIKEKGSSELLIGVNAYIPTLKAGTSSNTYGFYSISLPADTIEVVFSYVGYKPQTHRIYLSKNTELNIELVSENTLREVVVTDERERQQVSRNAQMSTVELPVQQIKDLPALLGEKDVMKALQLMPGVQSGSEGNSGLYVRGGGPDQNLIILDDATVYNAYHLFGFFSLFNGDALKSVELTKGGFPARYGGRLSSVLEMNMKEGNKEQLSGETGIGLISSRLTLEGPLKKGKSSFLISGRRTYLDVLTKPFMPQYYKIGYFFYDLNTKLNYDFGRKNKLYLSGYFGRDQFGADINEQSLSSNYKSRAGLFWGNTTATARWNHLINERLFTNTSLIYSNYNFNIFNREVSDLSSFELKYSSRIRDIGFKHDIDYLPSIKHSLKIGITSVSHRFTPSALVVKATNSETINQQSIPLYAQESGLYIEDNYRPTSRIFINAGLRLSHFYTQGKQYLNPEPRLSAAYMLQEDLSAKASYATMNQYVHLLSNTGIGLPTDLWVPTTKRVAPQHSQQVAAGLAKDFMSKNFSVTLEGYYKKSANVIAYKEGASFLLIDGPEEGNKTDWQNNITPGQAWSYGAELLIQRKFGRLSGWIGYTLSWTQLQFDSLNLGQKFYARHDRRHDISAVGIYKLSPRITLSGTWVYGTGNALTLPLASFQARPHSPHNAPQNNSFAYQYTNAEDFGLRNSFRMAAYHRMDIGIQFHKQIQKFARPMLRTWDLSVYNAYNRRNPFFYYTDQKYLGDNQFETILKQISLFPLIPSITYSLKF